jgi:glycosyltransferase involved in cell wall biosynthesis
LNQQRIVILGGVVPTTTFIDALINAMAEEGFKMIVIGKKTGTPRYHKNVDVVVTPVGNFRQLLFIIKHLFKADPRYTRQIFSRRKSFATLFVELLYCLPIANAKPDKIHIQWATFLDEVLFDLFPGKILLSLRGAHVNYTPITNPEVKEVYLKLFPRVHQFHAVSDAIANEAAKYNADKEKIKTIYSYVNDELVNKTIRPKEKKDLQMVSVGRFHWKKGYDYALDALAIVKAKKIPFTYIIIAQGSIPDSIIFQIHQLNLNDCVKIVNGLPHKDVLKAIEESDLLLLPSIEEGIANVALEAMAAGTPVISTDCGGMNEVITDRISGLIVKLRDTDAMANAIISFNNLPQNDRLALAVEAKKRIREFHNSQVFRKNFSDFYMS